MGKTYYVPRSVKGESRLLYIFTIKSFVTTVAFGLFGLLLWTIGSSIVSAIQRAAGITPGGGGLIPSLIFTAIFAAIGFGFGALKIPDIPIMGKFRKAGGENLTDITFRFITFRRKKKIYMYNLNRGGKK